jgi:hypothetical protein
VIALAWALACTGSTDDTGTPGDNSPDGPPTVPYVGVTERSPADIEHPISWTCDLRGWTYDFAVVGLSGEATLQLVETNTRFTDPTDELHALTPSDTDPDGWWTRYHLELLTDGEGTWVDGATTNAACEGSNVEALEMSWQLIVHDRDGDRADCAVWGEHPLGFDDTDCYIW